MTSVRITLSASVLKLLLALALTVGVGLISATPALAQGQYAPPTQFNVADIPRPQIDEDGGIIAADEDEGSPAASRTSSGRVPAGSTANSAGSPKAGTPSSGRVPLTAASGPEAGKAKAAGKAKSGRSSVQGVLPATGGPLLSIVLLAGLALAGSGMLVLRQFRGRE